MPAAAGIPVTHRGVARGFTVVTGHEEHPGAADRRRPHLVLLMGVGRLARTAELLLEHGRPADCPVAVVERGFAPDQRITFGTVADIAELARERGVRDPRRRRRRRRRAPQPRLPPLSAREPPGVVSTGRHGDQVDQMPEKLAHRTTYDTVVRRVLVALPRLVDDVVGELGHGGVGAVGAGRRRAS